jgi:two-component system sensor histidine kinase BaeS
VKFPIGLRLFLTVLLSIFGVAAIVLMIMSEKVSRNFSDYATKIELSRLEEISESIQIQFHHQQNWSFLPTSKNEQETWIANELLRLHNIRNVGYNKQIIDSSVMEEKMKDKDIAPSTPSNKPAQALEKFTIDTMLPPLSPAPPAPPAPPAQAELPEPPAPPSPNVSPSIKKIASKPLFRNDNNKEAITNTLPSLFHRITLLDTNLNYLAGRSLDLLPSEKKSLLANGKIIGYLQVTRSILPTDDMAKEFLRVQTSTITTIILVSIFLSAITASLLAVHFKKPISNLVEGARLLSKGIYETRLNTDRSDELGELALSFNQLADQLNQAEKNRRQWVADTSHELRTPISVLRAQLEAIQDGIRQATPENIAIMHRQILSLNKLIDELYALSRADVGELIYQMQQFDIGTLAHEEANNFSEKFKASNLNLTISPLNSPFEILGDVERMKQVFSNLFENCIRYTDAGGNISVQIKISHNNVIITIDDSAPSVPKAALSQLSERFYRVDASRNRQDGGSGLGLALCKRIISSHHGEIIFSQSPIGGLRVSLHIPLVNKVNSKIESV